MLLLLVRRRPTPLSFEFGGLDPGVGRLNRCFMGSVRALTRECVALARLPPSCGVAPALAYAKPQSERLSSSGVSSAPRRAKVPHRGMDAGPVVAIATPLKGSKRPLAPRYPPLSAGICHNLVNGLELALADVAMRESRFSRPKDVRLSCLLGLIAAGAVMCGFVRPVLAEGSSANGESNRHLSELLYVNAEGGAEYVGFQQLHLTHELFPSSIRTVDVGPAVGVGAGVRILFLTIGPRFRYGVFQDWDLWSLDAEAGLRIPLGSVEPWRY